MRNTLLRGKNKSYIEIAGERNSFLQDYDMTAIVGGFSERPVVLGITISTDH